MNPKSTRARVPAFSVLNYLFHITLGVLYAACVLAYSFSNGRFRHAYAPPNVIIASLSISTISVPIVFFCLSIWKEEIKGWGDYVRLVGSAAASVIVWDWIDQTEIRIEKDHKGGILGREVFEDEMYDYRSHKKEHKTERKEFKDESGGHVRKFLKRWPQRTTGKIDPVLELPVVRHTTKVAASVTRRADRTESDGIIVTEPNTFNHPRSFLNRRYSMESSAQDSTSSPSSYTYGAGSSTRSSRPMLGSQGDQQMIPDTVLHPGFSEGDYWRDEKGEEGSVTR